MVKKTFNRHDFHNFDRMAGLTFPFPVVSLENGAGDLPPPDPWISFFILSYFAVFKSSMPKPMSICRSEFFREKSGDRKWKVDFGKGSCICSDNWNLIFEIWYLNSYVWNLKSNFLILIYVMWFGYLRIEYLKSWCDIWFLNSWGILCNLW